MAFLRYLGVAVLFIAACVANAQTGSTQSAAGSAEALLLKLDSDFNKATQERRLEGWMEYMADDVVLRRGQNVVGREAVQAALAREWGNPKYRLTWAPEAAHMAAGGKVGVAWGKWSGEFPVPNGETLKMTGTYITIWEKQKDGSWKVIWDGGGADPVKR